MTHENEQNVPMECKMKFNYDNNERCDEKIIEFP